MTRRTAVITATLLFTAFPVFGFVTYTFLTSSDFASVDFDTFEWKERGEGFVTEEAVSSNQHVCICGGYECMAVDPPRFEGTDIEPTHLAYEGWLRRYYIIVKDPLAPDGDHNWGRPVVGEAKCVSKTKGEIVKYTLTEFVSSDRSGTESVPQLILTIE